jgi:nicotinamidase-related amidase
MDQTSAHHHEPWRTPAGDTEAQNVRDWRPFALVLIDVQHDFWPEPTAAQFPLFPGNVSRLLAFCRAEGIDVVHLRARFRRDMSDWMVNAKLRGRIPCIDGTPGVETLPFARERPGEAVIVKRTWDGFQGPELPAYLRDKGKRFLLTAGLVTSVCVLFTTASAAQRGFLTAVVEDCCADRPAAHEQTLTRYGGLVFRRTTVAGLLEGYAAWRAALLRLGDLQGNAAAPLLAPERAGVAP